MRLALLLVPMLAMASGPSFSPYSAVWTETTNYTDAAGNKSGSVRAGREYRITDGSRAITQELNGQTQSMDVSVACGDTVHIDYAHKMMGSGGHPIGALSGHLNLPPMKPLGKETISGIETAIYPMDVPNGTGKVWVDLSNDLILKTVMDFTVPTGEHYIIMRTLSSVYIGDPQAQDHVKLPAGFQRTTDKPKACN